jgi:hypothetical protein
MLCPFPKHLCLQRHMSWSFLCSITEIRIDCPFYWYWYIIVDHHCLNCFFNISVTWLLHIGLTESILILLPYFHSEIGVIAIELMVSESKFRYVWNFSFSLYISISTKQTVTSKTLIIQTLAWDQHKNVTGTNRPMGSPKLDLKRHCIHKQKIETLHRFTYTIKTTFYHKKMNDIIYT